MLTNYKRVAVTSLLVFVFAHLTLAQDFGQSKAAVVKITASEGISPRVGTGFIVTKTQDQTYILTAAHLLEGAGHIEVEFFTRRGASIPAQIERAQYADAKGLAILKVPKDQTPAG